MPLSYHHGEWQYKGRIIPQITSFHFTFLSTLISISVCTIFLSHNKKAKQNKTRNEITPKKNIRFLRDKIYKMQTPKKIPLKKDG